MGSDQQRYDRGRGDHATRDCRAEQRLLRVLGTARRGGGRMVDQRPGQPFRRRRCVIAGDFAELSGRRLRAAPVRWWHCAGRHSVRRAVYSGFSQRCRRCVQHPQRLDHRLSAGRNADTNRDADSDGHPDPDGHRDIDRHRVGHAYSPTDGGQPAPRRAAPRCAAPRLTTPPPAPRRPTGCATAGSRRAAAASRCTGTCDEAPTERP